MMQPARATEETAWAHLGGRGNVKKKPISYCHFRDPDSITIKYYTHLVISIRAEISPHGFAFHYGLGGDCDVVSFVVFPWGKSKRQTFPKPPVPDTRLTPPWFSLMKYLTSSG